MKKLEKIVFMRYSTHTKKDKLITWIKNMKNNAIVALLMGILAFTAVASAEEKWEPSQPGTADIGNSISVNRSYLGMYIPSSFEGRKAKETRNTFTLELKNKVRIMHSDAEVKLKGLANNMDFDYKSDIIDVQVFRSDNMRPSSSACMDCHGEVIPRTMATIGYGQTRTDEYSYAGNNFVKANSKFFKAAVDHWMKNKLLLRGELRLGKVKQGSISENATSLSIGLGGTIDHRITWSGDYIFSKVSSFKARNILVGRIAFRIIKGLKFKFEAGAFLDGYAQFGNNMTEMGLATIEPVKKYKESLPSLFEKLKNDKFGYYNASIEYEYRF